MWPRTPEPTLRNPGARDIGGIAIMDSLSSLSDTGAAAIRISFSNQLCPYPAEEQVRPREVADHVLSTQLCLKVALY